MKDLSKNNGYWMVAVWQTESWDITHDEFVPRIGEILALPDSNGYPSYYQVDQIIHSWNVPSTDSDGNPLMVHRITLNLLKRT